MNNKQKIINKNNYDSIHQYRMAIVGAIFGFLGIIFLLYSMISRSIQYDAWQIFWFGDFQYFTQQSNLLCYFVFIMLLFKPKTKLFKNYNLLTATTSYITITGIIWTLFLFPILIPSYADHDYSFIIPNILYNIFLHIIIPCLFVATFIVFIAFNKTKHSKASDWKFVLCSLIYPLIFAIYAIFIPFVSEGLGQYANPELHSNSNQMFGYTYVSVYGIMTDFKEHADVAWITFVFMPIIFSLTLYLYYNASKKSNRFIFFKNIKIKYFGKK